MEKLSEEILNQEINIQRGTSSMKTFIKDGDVGGAILNINGVEICLDQQQYEEWREVSALNARETLARLIAIRRAVIEVKRQEIIQKYKGISK
jgi:hypothetical protein